MYIGCMCLAYCNKEKVGRERERERRRERGRERGRDEVREGEQSERDLALMSTGSSPPPRYVHPPKLSTFELCKSPRQLFITRNV